MRRRRSTICFTLLALLGSAAMLGPEAGHSKLHHDGHDAVIAPAPGDLPAFEHGHGAGDHSHPDLRATPPGRTLLPLALPARSGLEHEGLLIPVRRVGGVIAHGLAPPEQAQAPPPPTRAPPLA